ncbi:MAG TPA: hypothetical protein VFR31_12620, partial [Thermoanaerobaculia bacterium]|nr:hypothetical protein [Thermoanaerobaculia bacterium]
MSNANADILARIRPFATTDVLGGLAETDIEVPTVDQLLFGVLRESTLTVYEQSGDEAPTIVTLSKVTYPVEGQDRVGDLGTTVPNRVYLFPTRPIPDTSFFPLILLDQEDGKTRFLFLPGQIQFDTTPDIRPKLMHRGMLFYNATSNPKPLFGFLSYEPDTWMTWRWHFIDLCVNLALQLLVDSEENLLDLRAEAELGTRSPVFMKMTRELRARAKSYANLELLLDSLKLLATLRWLRYLPSFDLMRKLQLDAALEEKYARLIDKELPSLEEKLSDGGDRLTLDDLIKKIDGLLVQLRQEAPLLGRLSWLQVNQSDDEGLARSVVALADWLLAQNHEAQAKGREDQKDIRRLFDVVPPRIMGIPRITQTVHRREQEKINSNVEYFFAVMHLEDEAARFGLMLGLTQLVFTFFCPPAGVALGFMQAAISMREAEYKTFLSNADVNIDQTLVSQAEAREERFWAAVDAIFACIDAAEFSKAVRTAREVEQAAKAKRLAEETEQLRQLAKAAGQDAGEVDRLVDGLHSAAKDTPPLDLGAARQETAQARKGTVDVSPDHPARLEQPPKTADEALAQAQKRDAAAWQELTGRAQGTAKGERTAKNARLKIEQEYRAHFDDAMKQRAQAQAKGLPLPPEPENPTHFMLRRRDELLVSRAGREAENFARQTPRPMREGFYSETARQSKKPLDQLLLNENRALLRDTLIKRVKKLKLRGLSGFDKDFMEAFQQAVKRGAPTHELDQLLAKQFIEPLDALAHKAGYAAGQGREFAIFGKGVAPVEHWADPEAFQSLRRLF